MQLESFDAHVFVALCLFLVINACHQIIHTAFIRYINIFQLLGISKKSFLFPLHACMHPNMQFENWLRLKMFYYAVWISVKINILKKKINNKNIFKAFLQPIETSTMMKNKTNQRNKKKDDRE